MKKIDLTLINGLEEELNALSTVDYPRVAITDRCVTIKGVHYIYETLYSSPATNDKEFRTFSSQSIDQTNLQLHVTQKIKSGYNRFNLVLKEQPGSRKCPFLGFKSQRDVLLCGFISES